MIQNFKLAQSYANERIYFTAMQPTASDVFDTSYIDMTSSAELAEAINSMFAWYRDSIVYYAYVANVPTISQDGKDPSRHFCSSRWFTRSKAGSLLSAVSQITGINKNFLNGNWHLRMASVAEKMS
ncbi:unnamed protein product [Clonostachys solani]|uniref:Uncharacterized protein n=1 Tax=Clonostachys solani TaxID=160281 RepID=A0A9P0EQX3_9HYPO|nr:unnamed protein product [Clonostachys solani]